MAERSGSLCHPWRVRAPGGRADPHGGRTASECTIAGWLVIGINDVARANTSPCTQLSDCLEPEAVFGWCCSPTSYLGGNPSIFLEFSSQQSLLEFSSQQSPPGSVFGCSSPRSSPEPSLICLPGREDFLGAHSHWRDIHASLSHTVITHRNVSHTFLTGGGLLREVRDALLPSLQND